MYIASSFKVYDLSDFISIDDNLQAFWMHESFQYYDYFIYLFTWELSLVLSEDLIMCMCALKSIQF